MAEERHQEQEPEANPGSHENSGAEEVSEATHLDTQLSANDDLGVDEALQAWREGGHEFNELGEEDEIRLVRLPQLEPAGTVDKGERHPQRLGNVRVSVVVELGRRQMTVREIAKLKEQDVIELNKLAGESFEVRVNGRCFAWGEVVVLTDMMAVRITSLVNPANSGAKLSID